MLRCIATNYNFPIYLATFSLLLRKAGMYEVMNSYLFFAVEYQSNWQSKANELLVLEGSLGGTQVGLSDGVMPYCPEQTNLRCSIRCTVAFPTLHSPSYSINGRCYSAGGMGKDLRPIGISATHNHPDYAIYFFCHAINTYRCVINGTIHSQEVRVEPGNTL